ncbi:hypothetical protein Ahy_B02g058294 [Arachis hypogaea]|uniref:Uncharacterized protein n=1 Tax=Arachis hypogaea TaxID=3818 RepID=A0A445AEC7_ARAHY|nr:hypothetical protein Ahy_B02g058294 [Arachis hypogaea]
MGTKVKVTLNMIMLAKMFDLTFFINSDTSTGEIITRKMIAIQVWTLKNENFEFDYAAGVKWALRTLGDRWKAHNYNLRGEYFFPNKRNAEILAANPSDIPPKQCLQNARNREKLIVSHAGGSKSNTRRATQMEKKLGRPVCRSKVIVSTLLKKDGSYEKIAEHLPEDQERAASLPLKRVRGFSNAVCPSGFGKSKRIFGGVICGSSNNTLQQHVADLERQLQEAKDQMATLQISTTEIR